MKTSLTYDKFKDNLTERNFLKPNNQSIDKANYLSNNNKNFNKMKFQHFNYEPNRAYYV